MQTLPTPLTTAQLDALLDTLGALPSAEVFRHAAICTVDARKKTTGETVRVFSAVTSDGETWTARAVDGLISKV